MRTIVAALALATMVTAPAQAQNPAGWAPPPAPKCPTGAECGVLIPPLIDHDALGRTPRAAYAFIRHKGWGKPAGTIAYNPGGPGSSAILSAKDIARFFGPDFDILLVDPRGTGASGALDCGLPDDVFVRSWETQLSELAECGERLGPEPERYGTVAAADDLEAVRRRLGIEKLDLYGQSYGSVLMTTYARRYPRRVRMMVLSGAYPADADPWGRYRAEALANAIRLVCARSHGRCRGAAVLRDLRTLAARLRRDPLPFAVSDGLRRYPQQFDEGFLAFVVYQSAYVPKRYGRLPRVLGAAVDGHSGPLLQLARQALAASVSVQALQGYDDVMLRYAVECWESRMPYDTRAPETQRRAQFFYALKRAGRAGPFSMEGWSNGPGSDPLSCLGWPAHPSTTPGTTAPMPKVPALIISGDLDAVSPPSAGRSVAARIPGAQFLEVSNVGHVPETQDRTGCVSEAIWRFFRSRLVVNQACAEHLPAVPVR
jgi:pimeloyl-ACP methyl ester carboxylesterase